MYRQTWNGSETDGVGYMGAFLSCEKLKDFDNTVIFYTGSMLQLTSRNFHDSLSLIEFVKEYEESSLSIKDPNFRAQQPFSSVLLPLQWASTRQWPQTLG